MRWFGRGLVTFGAILLGAAPALTCPLCESEAGQQVRAGIFNEDFGYNLLLTASPFPVLLGIVALIHFGWPGPRATARPAPEAEAPRQAVP